MEKRTITLTPKLEKILTELGGNLRLARLRRKLTAEQVCERANISRTTLWQIEKGMYNVAIGAYAQVLFILGLEKDLLQVAVGDELGRRLQDAELEIKKRGARRK
ncbi:MAG: transcriptional regulator [Chitinophagaceae bacterium]|nr:transcriptional regulator [Chitinophagaceae bacterium]